MLDDRMQERRTLSYDVKINYPRIIDRVIAKEAQLNTILETVPVGVVMGEFPSGKIVGGNKYVEQMLRHPVLYSPDINSYDKWVSFHEDGSRVEGHEYPFAAIMLRGEENPSDVSPRS